MTQKVEPYDPYSTTIFGFWVYIMTDCLLFGSLFATYAVLHNETFGGPGAKELFSMPYVLAETIFLLASSFSCGLARQAAHREEMKKTVSWLCLTFILGILFVGFELNEFIHLIDEGNSWRRSGFLSAFFTLVGTHGAHVSVGLLWMIVVVAQMLHRGFTETIFKRLMCLGLFWHFLDVVWIFIFTFVYLMGAL